MGLVWSGLVVTPHLYLICVDLIMQSTLSLPSDDKHDNLQVPNIIMTEEANYDSVHTYSTRNIQQYSLYKFCIFFLAFMDDFSRVVMGELYSPLKIYCHSNFTLGLYDRKRGVFHITRWSYFVVELDRLTRWESIVQMLGIVSDIELSQGSPSCFASSVLYG